MFKGVGVLLVVLVGLGCFWGGYRTTNIRGTLRGVGESSRVGFSQTYSRRIYSLPRNLY